MKVGKRLVGKRNSALGGRDMRGSESKRKPNLVSQYVKLGKTKFN